MKKLFALFITLLLFSCSTEENGNNSVDPLIGVWEGEIIDTELEEVYIVTLTASTEFLKQGIRLFPMTSSTTTGAAMAPEFTYRGECEYIDTPSGIDLRYEVQEFTWENFQQTVNKDLADVLGNFVSRVTKFCRSKFGEVFISKTSPNFVIGDYAKLLADTKIQNFIDNKLKTLIKANISWQHYFPACSTEPCQLEGVIRGLRSLGISNLEVAHNGTVVVNAREGQENNGFLKIEKDLSIKSTVLDDPGQEWINYVPKNKMIVLNKIYPEGIMIPRKLLETNIIHLPTVKTHVFTTITGAMKNAFGGLLHKNRHWAHADIHNTLVDLLTIQYEIHNNVFAVMDGTFAGDGPVSYTHLTLPTNREV